MKLKLLFLCLFLAVLLGPAELRRFKNRHNHHSHGQGPLYKHGKLLVDEITADEHFGILESDDDEDDDDDEEPLEWLFKLQEPEGQCNPNPCKNNGSCEEKGKSKYKCDCPKPFKGRKCERGRKHCKKGRCGRGECVLTSTPPHYECKCKEPFQPPHCRHMALCEPNPCRNGGECIQDGRDFDCQCPEGFRGRFCHVGPNDCYVDDGESYRGNVSETDDGHECLYWNSHFILENGADPFNSFEDKDGLGRHNFCRNPDGDTMPWCFYRKGRKLSWDYCDVTECPEPTGVAPTDVVPPTAPPAEPQPTTPVTTTTTPPTPEKPSQAPTITTTATTAKTTATPVETTATPVETTATPAKTTAAPAETTAAPAETTAAPAETTAAPAETTPAPLEQFTTCGKAEPKTSNSRIFGGLKVPPGSVPWQVSLQVRPKNSLQPFSHTCGGVLIESCWVLTAGHCIDPTKDMQVVVGAQSLAMEEPSEQSLKVTEAIVHENYRETRWAVYNDIALLRLQGTEGHCANESQFVKTACLPDAQLPDGMECTISGWGVTEDSVHGSSHLLQANVLLINQEKCSESKVYGNTLDNTMFCAGYLRGGVDSCQGDSGGPLTCQQNQTSVIYGLVSWGDQCGKKNKPGVYTRVTHYLDWIRSKIQAATP